MPSPSIPWLPKHVNAGPWLTHYTSWNGIVGRIRNYFALDGRLLMDRVMDAARRDVRELLHQ